MKNREEEKKQKNDNELRGTKEREDSKEERRRRSGRQNVFPLSPQSFKKTAWHRYFILFFI